MADVYKGLTVQLGGDTTGLSKALSSVNKDISNTQKELKQVERLLKLDPTNTKLLEQKQRLLGDAIGDTKTKLDALKQAEKQVQEQFAAGKGNQEQYDALQREIVDTEQKLKSLEKQARQFGSVFSQQMQVAGEKMQNVGGKISDVGKKLLPITGAVAGIGAAAVKTSADFDSAMSNVQALSGASGEELDKLRSAALEMGESTAFSATEAADALGYMALAGWDSEQSVAALPAVLNLAAASGMDLAAASDMVTDYLSAFGLEASDAAYFSDLLAFAQANSNTTAEQLGEAYKNCAANLHAAGQDVETVTSILEAMAQQSLKGSEAGTALSAIMRDITAKMDNGAIKIGDVSVAVQDADGNFRDLTDILSDVQTATEGMGNAQKASALASTFTADSIKGLNMILNYGVDSVAGYEDSLRTGLGTASQQAEARLDNLSGQVTLLKSALDVAAISIADTLTPMISQLVGWVQQAVDWFNSLDEGQQQMIVTIGLAAAAIGPLLMILGNIVRSVGSIATAVGSLSGFITGTVAPAITGALSGLFSFLAANPVIAIIAAIAAAVVALTFLVVNHIDEIKAFLSAFVQRCADLWENFVSMSLSQMDAAKNGIRDAIESIKGIVNGIVEFVRGPFANAWERAWNGVKDIFGGIFSGLTALAKAPLNAIIGLVNSAIGGINGVIGTLNKLPGVSIGTIGTIPMLANGGVLSRGSAIVGDAGPELLTVTGGQAVVQPLTNNTSHTNNYGATNIYVYGAPGQDVNELAEVLMEKIEFATRRKEAQFA